MRCANGCGHDWASAEVVDVVLKMLAAPEFLGLLRRRLLNLVGAVRIWAAQDLRRGGGAAQTGV